MDFLTLAKERYSVRRLAARPVEREKIDRIIGAAHAAPSERRALSKPKEALVIEP